MISFEKTLFKISKNGKVDQWNCKVSRNAIITTWGKIDGKSQEKIEVIEQGKNIGKSNETTPHEQALSEAQSKVNSQYDKGYRDTIEMAKEVLTDLRSVKPMLAHDYTLKNNKDKIKWAEGVIVQPKLDGLRLCCKMHKKISGLELETVSRNNKHVTLPASLQTQVYEFMKANRLTYIDGELYIHGELFEDLVSCVKKPEGNKLYDKLEYHIFEIPPTSTLELENTYDISMLDRLQFVESKLVRSEKEAEDLLQSYLLSGYEGIMLRNMYYDYEFNVRSYSLMKWKEFYTDEYEIVDIIPDKDGHGKLVCKLNESGGLFEAVPKGTHEYKSEIVEYKNLYIGKLATIKYQNLTSDGVPRFPVAIELDRDE